MMPSVLLPSTRLAKEFARLHDKLRRVFNFMLESAWPEEKELRIVCIYRTLDEEHAIEAEVLKATGKEYHTSGVHHTIPHRAIDIRTWPLTDAELASTTIRVNNRFTYDPQRPKLPVAYSEPHGTGPHLHLQASDFTEEHDGPEGA